MKVEYWQNSWANPAPERRKGAVRGWIGTDDPWHGRWITASTRTRVDNNHSIYRFEHLDITELPDEKKLLEAEDYNAFFRRTLKVLLIFQENFSPKITEFKIYSKSTKIKHLPYSRYILESLGLPSWTKNGSRIYL